MIAMGRPLQPLARHRDHLRRAIAGHHVDPSVRKVRRIDSGATINLQHALPRVEQVIQFPPNRRALCPSNQRIREAGIVLARNTVKGFNSGTCLVRCNGDHGSGLHFLYRGLHSLPRLRNSLAEFSLGQPVTGCFRIH